MHTEHQVEQEKHREVPHPRMAEWKLFIKPQPRRMRIRLDERAVTRRPQTRAACRDGVRPCPFVSCRYHLFLDVNPRTGHIRFNFPETDVMEMKCSCALDLAEKGPYTLEDIGRQLNVTRERARQVAEKALQKIHTNLFPEEVEEE